MTLMDRLSVQLLNAAVAVIAGTFDMAAAASSLPANEYIPYHPTGCRYVRKSPDGKLSFVQTCSREPTGEWEQFIEAIELATPGVIFIPRQRLVSGVDIEGYWCSGAAPRAFKDKFQSCTESGWDNTGTGNSDLDAISIPPADLAEQLRPDPAARPPTRFEASLDSLVRDGVVSPAERARIRGMDPNVSAHQQACRSGALSPQECSSGVVVRWRGLQNTVSGPTIKPLSQNEQAVLQRIRSSGYTPKWRTYGQCKYDWSGWKLHSNGTRSTAVDCGGSAMRWTVGVSCDRFLVAAYTTASGWSKWREPAGPGNKSRQGEDEMVAALCANI